MITFGGYQKLTLLDYPGKVACTVFTGGCNFRCPFCHNSELFVPSETFSEEDIMQMIAKRKNVLEGVAITGGEPTLQPGLTDFMRGVHDLGLLVKLDTNGYDPAKLKEILDNKLADYIAVDIKSSKEHYGEVAGLPNIDISKIEKSVDMLLSGDVPFEFRTTVIPELHAEDDFLAIGEWIRGDEPYFLQGYKDSEMVYDRKFSQPTLELMEKIKSIVIPYVPNTEIRGVE